MRIRLRDRFRYRAELVFFRFGTLGLAAALVGASLAMLAMGTVLAVVVGVRFGGEAEPATPVEAAWHSLTRLLDGGTFSQDEEWPTRASMLMVTLGGMLIVSAFVGVVTEGIRSKTAEWREGRVPVDEQGHSLVLGWGPMVYATVQQLCIAGENQASNCIVLLSERPRLEMESLLQARLPDRHGARVVCRSGSPSDIDDLILVQAHRAKSVIVLPSKQSTDATTIKTVLAVAEESRRLGSEPHIIAPIFRQSFMPVAKLAAPEHCQLVDVERLICNLEAQASRSPGIGEAITQLFNFEGSELYALPPGELRGRPMSEAVHGFEGACVIGVSEPGGGLVLAPHPDRIVKEDDLLVAITEDDDPACWGVRSRDRIQAVIHSTDPLVSGLGASPKTLPRVRRIAIIGWTRRGRELVEAIDAFAFGGLTLTVVATPEKIAQSRRELARSEVAGIEWFEVRDDEWEDAEDPICQSDVVLVIADRDREDPERSDAEVLLNLLRLRHLKNERGASFRVVTELVDRRNQELAMSTDPDDLIVTGSLLAHALTQFIDNESGGRVLQDLLEPGGASIFVIPLDCLGIGDASSKVSFETLVRAAVPQRCYPIGIKFGGLPSEGPALSTVLNPERSAGLSLTPDDRVIVVASGDSIRRMFGVGDSHDS